MNAKTERKIELKRQHIFLLLQQIEELEGTHYLCVFPEVSDHDDEKWRINRINQVMGFISAINPSIIGKIKSINDHKGFLTVAWKEAPSKWEMDVVNFAWGEGDGNPDNTEHIMNIVKKL